MKFTMLSANFILILVLMTGCNGSRNVNSGRRDTARSVARSPRGRAQYDPALVASLKRLEEPSGSLYTVSKGDTFYGLSRRHHVPLSALKAANPGIVPGRIRVGQKIVIPGYRRPGKPVASVSPVDPLPNPIGPRPGRSKTPDRGRLRYPVSSKYRNSQGGVPGIEFQVAAGTAVVAAGSGKVVVATADLGGLGPTLMIDHGNGIVTLYGRLSDYAVKAGSRVKRGESIGRVGAMGLLFRVYQGSVPRAPGPYIK
jgi:murein DD-endopeptidase MepM/ murein hydrolase activator NlpD